MKFKLPFITVTIERTDNVRRRVEAALRVGRVEALREHRTLTGSTLKEAIEYVNTMLPEGQRIGDAARGWNEQR